MISTQDSPILFQIDAEVLALSELYKTTVTAFIGQDSQGFDALRNTYFKRLIRYFELVRDTLYWPLRHMIESDDTKIMMESFEKETFDFHSRLSVCLTNLRSVGVEESSEYEGDIYAIDRTIVNQHLKEKEFLYPLYEENTWLVLELDRSQDICIAA